MQFVDLKSQYKAYKKEIDRAMAQVMDSCQFILGPQVTELEETLANDCSVGHCITTASGTDSLLIALMALGVSAGDEVVTVPFTWISTSEVIALLGAKPVFVDIDPDTYNMDVNQLEEAITPRTKAIMPVGLFGQMPDMVRINEIADRYGIPVIEDAAQSLGATQAGIKSCGASTIGSTSFFPAKAFGCYGDGGALFTDDDQLARQMRAIRTHGGLERNYHTCVGINGRFDTLQAAVLLAKWPHYESEIAKRQELAARYSDGLRSCAKVPVVAPDHTHVFACYVIELEDRDHVASELKEKGIPTAVYYPKCLHEQPVFADLGYEIGDFPVAEQASRKVLSLPIHPWLKKEEQELIIESIQAAALVTA